MKTRTVCLLALPAAVLLGTGVLMMRHAPQEGIPAAQEDDRRVYLFMQGWKGDEIAVQEVTVPESDDTVFSEYAALQESQGLPLARFRGECAVRYTYQLRDSALYAELLAADGILIGAACYDPETHVWLDIQGNTTA